jgi:hypothetical protein
VSDVSDPQQRSFPLPHILQPGEVLETRAAAQDAVVAVTSRRLMVTEGERLVLDVPFSELRRVQFDIERGRPATLVIVPEHIANEPRVVAVPISSLRDAALALAAIGERLNPTSEQEAE